jgi:hypothetical protein
MEVKATNSAIKMIKKTTIRILLTFFIEAAP